MLCLLADAPSSILAALSGRSDCYQGIHKLRQSVHCSRGGLDRIATRLLNEINVVIDLCRVRYFQGWKLGATGGSSSRQERVIGVVTSRLLELECKEELIIVRRFPARAQTVHCKVSLGVCSQTTGLHSIETERP